MFKTNSHKKVLNFVTISKPFSSDPMDYDLYIHHQAFTSVFGNLVSLGKKGEVVSQIAQSWSHDESAKKWVFIINNNLKYSNGDVITAADIEMNLKRVAFLKSKNNSQSGLFEYIEGFESIKKLNDVKGIYSEGNQLFLNFIQPMPDLLSKISFGFYSLAHPSLYDHQTGEWKNKHRTISSGPYEVVKWDDNSFELGLRKNIQYVDYNNAIEKISFIDLSLIKQSSDLNDVDILIADKSSLMVDSSFEYIGSSEGFKIGYVHCYGWDKVNSPLNNLEIRKWMRFKFYKGLQKSHFEIINSFFPSTFAGIKKFDLDFEIPKPVFKKFKIITHTMSAALKINENINQKSIPEIFNLALRNIGEDSDIEVEQIKFEDSMEIEKVMDIAINGTGIEADDFLSTVKFMFLSKHGINLPDSTGVILNELKKNNPDIDIINKELWNQAIIWPIRYYTKGYWFKKDSLINYDQLNLDLPAIDFQFIKWK